MSGLPESLRAPREMGGLGEGMSSRKPSPPKKEQRGTDFPPENAILCRTHRERVFFAVEFLCTPSADSRMRNTSEVGGQTEDTRFTCDLR